jgi:hypothetical protein
MLLRVRLDDHVIGGAAGHGESQAGAAVVLGGRCLPGSEPGEVWMVRRRSTIRVRKGAPGHRAFSSIKPSALPAVSGTLSVTRFECASRSPGISWMWSVSPVGNSSRDLENSRLSWQPVGFQNSATSPELGFYAARSYSLMRPPRTGRRLIRFLERSATGWSGRGCRSWRQRCGRRPL